MFFQKKDKEDAQELMDALSEKYKGFESELIDTTNFRIIISDLNTAYVDSKYMDGTFYEHYVVDLKWYHKLIMLKLDNLIDHKIKVLKNKYVKKNKNVKEIINLKAKYNDTTTGNTPIFGTMSRAYMSLPPMRPFSGNFHNSTNIFTASPKSKNELRKRGLRL